MTRHNCAALAFATLLVLPIGCDSGDTDTNPNMSGAGGATSGRGGGSGAMAGMGGGSAGASAGRGGSSAGSGGARAGSSGATAGMGGAMAGMGGATAGAAGGSAGSGGARAGAGGAAGGGGGSGATAQSFCSSYMTHCSFGAAMRYASDQVCRTMYEGFSATRKDCVVMHLGFVSGRMGMADYESYKTMHCPHATGLAVCTN